MVFSINRSFILSGVFIKTKPEQMVSRKKTKSLQYKNQKSLIETKTQIHFSDFIAKDSH